MISIADREVALCAGLLVIQYAIASLWLQDDRGILAGDYSPFATVLSKRARRISSDHPGWWRLKVSHKADGVALLGLLSAVSGDQTPRPLINLNRMATTAMTSRT